MNSPDVVIRIDRKAILAVGTLVLMVAFGPWLWAETLTLVTTYPAPSGIYNQIVTTGDSGSAPADTTLNRNAGNTMLVPGTNGGGKVGIGMTPVNKLDVFGTIGATGRISAASAVFTAGIQLGDDLSTCTPAKNGTQRWHSDNLEVCVGAIAQWQPVQAMWRSGTLGGGCSPTGPSGGVRPYWPVTSCNAFTCTFNATRIIEVSTCFPGWSPGLFTEQCNGTFRPSACIKD